MYLFIINLLINCLILCQSSPQKVTTIVKCADTFSCLTVAECGRIHPKKPSTLVYFQCSNKDNRKICCPLPPITESSVDTDEDYAESIRLMNHENYKLLPQTGHCGQFEDRIIEGETAYLGMFPWMALLGFQTSGVSEIDYSCGGTLISNRYVLTAAHCLTSKSQQLVHVRLGEHDTKKQVDCDGNDVCQEPEDVPVDEIILHESWNRASLKNDIALVRLSREIKRDTINKFIGPICLPFNLTQFGMNDASNFTVAGWGLTEYKQPTSKSNVLLFAQIRGKTIPECRMCQNERPEPYCPLDQRQMCVQGVHGVDVCKGDSGGPLMTTNTYPVMQVGITSFKEVPECGADNIPSIFTRTQKYLRWILDHMKE